MKNKKAFSFVELIIVLTIITLLSIVVFKISSDSKDKTTNAQIESDILGISNALKANIEEKSSFEGLPVGNKNYYKNNGAYSHEKFEEENPAFGVYGKINSEILDKKYLSEVPKDPRTGEFYSFGILNDKKTFEIAGVVKKDGKYLAKVTGNYAGDKGVIGLIREYNGPYFIVDGSENLPYNPEKIVLTATDNDKNIFSDGDKIIYENKKFTRNGENFNASLKKSEEKYFYDLYFSDGTIARMELENENEKFSLTIGKPNEKLLVLEEGGKKSKLFTFLEAGKLWIFAPDKGENSEIQVGTQDLTAAVRGTIFKIEKISTTKVKLFKGKLEIFNNNASKITDLEEGKIFENGNVNDLNEEEKKEGDFINGKLYKSKDQEGNFYYNYNKTTKEVIINEKGKLEDDYCKNSNQENLCIPIKIDGLTEKIPLNFSDDKAKNDEEIEKLNRELGMGYKIKNPINDETTHLYRKSDLTENEAEKINENEKSIVLKDNFVIKIGLSGELLASEVTENKIFLKINGKDFYISKHNENSNNLAIEGFSRYIFNIKKEKINKDEIYNLIILKDAIQLVNSKNEVLYLYIENNNDEKEKEIIKIFENQIKKLNQIKTLNIDENNIINFFKLYN